VGRVLECARDGFPIFDLPFDLLAEGRVMRWVRVGLVLVFMVGSGVLIQGPLADRRMETSAGRLRITTITASLEHPWAVAFLPDGRLLAAERPGRIRIVDSNGRLSPPLQGMPPVFAQGEAGLLDLVLDPQFASTGAVFFSYAEPGTTGASTAVARARIADDRLLETRVIFRQEPKTIADAHFGSRLVFLPDGTLDIALGELNKRDEAQNLSNHLGKIVRIRKDGSVPADNPFLGQPSARPEIWSLGHRNVQGAAVNPVTGELWIAEHGPRGGDEINVVIAGGNYGWPVIGYGRHYDGSQVGVGTEKEGLEQPIHHWDAAIAPSGMAFYTGDRIQPWRGSLFIGALRGRALIRLVFDGHRMVQEERLLTFLGERIRDVRQGPDGRLYVLTDSPNGRILRLDVAAE
jgi:glucose/arabinose dehydrogenase